MLVAVRTGSRLHLGLLSVAHDVASAPERDGLPAHIDRRFGGVGLMVQGPGVHLCAAPATTWSAAGPLADRALRFARQTAQAVTDECGVTPQPLHFQVHAAAPEHVGLGTGTQLGLAVAGAAVATWGLQSDLVSLARWSARGRRSAVGVHGFARGGLIVDAGKRTTSTLAPLATRVEWPEQWRVVLALPVGLPAPVKGLHGKAEAEVFAQLAGAEAAAPTEALCRIVLLGLLPAAAESDLQSFGEALFDFNRRAGEAFATVQGGTYAGSAVAGLVTFFRAHGIRGVGQSSWGPTVFAVVGDADEAHAVARRVRERGPIPVEVVVTTPLNEGATVESGLGAV
jgi:beta-RFAP synthase